MFASVSFPYEMVPHGFVEGKKKIYNFVWGKPTTITKILKINLETLIQGSFYFYQCLYFYIFVKIS